MVHYRPISAIAVFIFIIIAFIAIHLFYFPQFYTSIDEREYIRNAFLLQQGTLTEPDITKACTGRFNGEGYISQYFIGRSVFLIPFTWGGLPFIMLSGLVIHLLNAFLFYKLLRRLHFHPVYTLLYFLFPAFFWASRTLGSELLALTGIFAGVYLYLGTRKQQTLSGLLFGLTLFIRYEIALIAMAFLMISILKDRKKFLSLLIGFVPAVAFLLIFNQTVYGGLLTGGYATPFSAFINMNPYDL